jgi:hypothetical protein
MCGQFCIYFPFFSQYAKKNAIKNFFWHLSTNLISLLTPEMF